MLNAGPIAVVVATLGLFSACVGQGQDVRPIAITIAADGCGSVPVHVEPAQRLRLDISNESRQQYEVAGPEGGLETLDIAPGETFEGFYFVPEGEASYAIFCTGADGSRSSIELNARSASGSPPIDLDNAATTSARPPPPWRSPSSSTPSPPAPRASRQDA